jgi:hypothetical protein
LVYTARWVARGSRWLVPGGIEDRPTPVPLCRCTRCRRRWRVLPIEIAPHKSYTRPVIETACAVYTDPDLPTLSLQNTVEGIGANAPHRGTLHGWLGGLGARTLGQLDGVRGWLPAAALVAESAQRLRDELAGWWTASSSIATTKYRSVARREQLQACVRLFHCCRRLFPRDAYPWCAWEHWLEVHFHVAAWAAPSRLASTAIQHSGARRFKVSCAPSFMHRSAARVAARVRAKRQTKGQGHGARSPP